MNERLARQIKTAALSGKQDVETGLVEALIAVGGDPLTVRGARDTLSAVLGKARQGAARIIGHNREEMTVVMSIKDLADIVRVASKPQSFGEALDAMGFKPVSRRFTVREGHPDVPLAKPAAARDGGSPMAM